MLIVDLFLVYIYNRRKVSLLKDVIFIRYVVTIVKKGRGLSERGYTIREIGRKGAA